MRSVRVLLLSLIVVTLSSCDQQTVEEVVKALANVPEIETRAVTIQINSQQQTICVAPILRNIGGVDVKGPFKVVIGITRWKQYPPGGGTPAFLFSEETVDVPPNVTIARAGGEYTTKCSQRELVYRDVDSNAVYELEIIADATNVIHEFDDWGNNRYKIEWWTIRPNP